MTKFLFVSGNREHGRNDSPPLNENLRCPIHLLQLAIKDALKEHDNISRLLTKVGSLVTSVRKSTLNTEECDRLGVRPSSACPTRWNSQLKMIQSLLRLFQKDPSWQNKMKLKSSSAQLSLNEVRQLTHLVDVLSPLADLTEKMQKVKKYLSFISFIHSFIHSFIFISFIHPIGTGKPRHDPPCCHGNKIHCW